MAVQDTFGENGQCSICKLSDIDSLNYGEIHATKDYAVHLFCLYFSADLPQNGKDTAGIVGFEIRDIRRLLSKCDNEICWYCHKGSATVRCHHPNCGRVFHQVCGFKANARFEYLGQFLAFCDEHNRIEDENLEYPEVVGCFLCYEGLGNFNPVTTVPSCCGLWFHQQCLRKYAVNAGYAFMCPICRDKNYGDFARRHGIYVPEYEALWEKTNDYADIERFYTHCDASNCICPKGRNFANYKWELQLCSCCGSFGYHKLCRPQNKRDDIIICDACSKTATEWRTNDPENEIFINPLSQTVLNEWGPEERIDVADDGVEMIHLTDDNIFKADTSGVADDVIETIDLTNGKISGKCIVGDTKDFEEIAEVISIAEDGVREIVLTDKALSRKDETIAAKRAREDAARPITDEMRDFRISLLFGDKKRIRRLQASNSLKINFK